MAEPPPLLRIKAVAGVVQAQPFDCPAEQQSSPWHLPGQGALSGTSPNTAELGPGPSPPPGGGPTAADYRQNLKATPAGWPVRSQWCVWIEPSSGGAQAGPFEARWLRAVEAALASWQAELPIQRVASPNQAQVRLWRRKPPLGPGAGGALRASHGRALLELRQVQRLGQWQLEPQVEVVISPGQRPEAIQATSLHELGHAFGLWGHSDDSGDAMAVSPNAKPVLDLSARDRATLRWLLLQPGLGP